MVKGDILPIEVMARRLEWSYGISLFMRQRTIGHGSTIAQPIVFAPFDDHLIAEPMIKLQIEQAQQLMDELWQCGIRPSEGAGSAGAMAATQKHLEDMRKLVFKEKK